MSPYKDPEKQREMNKKYQKKYYEKNKQYYKEKAAERRRKLRDKVREIRQSKVCEICGESRWYCLDFHHIDKDEKEADINNLVSRGVSWKRIKEEISKCQVLCRNCHAEVHWG